MSSRKPLCVDSETGETLDRIHSHRHRQDVAKGEAHFCCAEQFCPPSKKNTKSIYQMGEPFRPGRARKTEREREGRGSLNQKASCLNVLYRPRPRHTLRCSLDSLIRAELSLLWPLSIFRLSQLWNQECLALYLKQRELSHEMLCHVTM